MGFPRAEESQAAVTATAVCGASVTIARPKSAADSGSRAIEVPSVTRRRAELGRAGGNFAALDGTVRLMRRLPPSQTWRTFPER
jgi:hypothetical protein